MYCKKEKNLVSQPQRGKEKKEETGVTSQHSSNPLSNLPLKEKKLSDTSQWWSLLLKKAGSMSFSRSQSPCSYVVPRKSLERGETVGDCVRRTVPKGEEKWTERDQNIEKSFDGL